jgi:hypothetical protein
MRKASRGARRSVDLAGQPLSREIFKLVQGADAVGVAEGNTDRNVSASAWLTLRGLRITPAGIWGASSNGCPYRDSDCGEVICMSAERPLSVL